MLFMIFILFVICQRILELVIAKRNETKMKRLGALEFGREHYRWMVLMHISFFVCFIFEAKNNDVSPIWPVWLTLFMIAQIGRVWVIRSLGEYWNTKIIVLPNAEVVKKGPYQYVRHPNYMIVAAEIIVISLLFQAYWTAALFTLLNIWMMSVRIPIEEKALKECTAYQSIFRKK